MRAWADISLEAVRANVALLRERAAPAQVCAVVKADGYGHGAVPIARAALDAGATWLAVAQVPEGMALRAAGITAPILLLSEPRPDEVADALDADLAVTVYTASMVAALSQAAAARARQVAVHLKVDTGMRRVGATPEDALALAKVVDADPALLLQAVWTHCAVADDPAPGFTAEQLGRYESLLGDLRAAGLEVPMRHVANSAAAILHPASRYDLVRCGIAVYGVPPAPSMSGTEPLEPVLRLATEVSFVKSVAAGDGVSYGLRHVVERPTRLATLPVGYADGVPRRQDVLIRGRRVPMVGAVTMDQVVVDVGPDSDVMAGDEAVLLGAQGDERITPDEWAQRLDTISYEIVCGIGPRVERRYSSS
jgi:alanine racemase